MTTFGGESGFMSRVSGGVDPSKVGTSSRIRKGDGCSPSVRVLRRHTLSGGGKGSQVQTQYRPLPNPLVRGKFLGQRVSLCPLCARATQDSGHLAGRRQGRS